VKIGITCNLKDEFSPELILNDEFSEEFDTPGTIEAICSVLKKNGHETVRLGGDLRIIEKLKAEKVDFVFNIAEGYFGRNREAHIPSILEMLGVPYSGSDPLTLSLTLDKIMAKKIAIQAGIPVPRYKEIRTAADLAFAEGRLNYPLIVKPAWEGSSKGIYDSSRVFDRKSLEISAKILFERYSNQPVLVEEYIEGREITVGVIGNEDARILGLMEVIDRRNPGKDVFYSLETKRNWKDLVDYVSPPALNRVFESHIKYRTLTAFREFGCRDFARIDFKVSEKSHKIFMLEINPLPGLSPEYADLVLMAKAQGVSYEELVMSIFRHAVLRYKETKASPTYEKM